MAASGQQSGCGKRTGISALICEMRLALPAQPWEATMDDGIKYHGHATLSDGAHVAPSEDVMMSLWNAAMQRKADAARDMPTTKDALNGMHTGLSRLRDLGWKDGIYCPKDGEPFAMIQFGSTGIFEGWYMGEWPDGRVYSCDYLSHPHGLMWKPLDALTDDERAEFEECMGREREAMDRVIDNMVGGDNG